MPERPVHRPSTAWLATLPIAAFAGVAWHHAAGSYLLADEAQQFLRADMPTLAEAFRVAFSQSHPPLYVTLLHLAMRVSVDQVFLRGLSIVAGAAALWLLFRWLQRAAGDRAALAGLVIAASSPAMLIAGQMRQYGLLLLAVCGALYSMERMLTERSVRWAVVHSLAIGAVLLTFYGGVWVVVALGLYVPLRLWRERAPAKVVYTWAAFQVCGAVIGIALLVGHLFELREVIPWAASGFLRGSYRGATEGPLEFAWRSTLNVFQSFAHGLPLREHPELGWLLLLLFVGGLGVVARGRGWRRDYALLLALPIVLACVGGVQGWLPFGGTRHVVYLLPFVAAGAAAAVAALVPRLGWVVVLALVLVPLRLWHAEPPVSARRQPIADVRAVIERIDERIPKGAMIFTDRQAFYLLRFYLGAGEPVQSVLTRSSIASEVAGYRLVGPRGTAWSFARGNFRITLASLANRMRVPRGTPVWVVSHGGPGAGLRDALPAGSDYERIGRFAIVTTTW